MSGLEEAGASLQSAVHCGSYAEAEEILAQYARAVEGAAGRLSPGDTQAVQIVRRAIDLLHGATRMVRAGRAHAASQLAQISAGRPYRALAARPTPTFTLDG
ncbi:MAG: hypothetical protein NT090_26080 [Acidobacteria bacterium]|nr:hypothetical protein [Acidobacteriota bacterium]